MGPNQTVTAIAYQAGSGLRYLDVWQTKDDYDAFERDRLHPVIHPILQDMLGFEPPEPSRTTLDLVDAWTAEHTLT